MVTECAIFHSRFNIAVKMPTVLLIFVVALVAAHAQPIDVAQNNQNIVPGVFISSETLKELQDKAQRNENSAITNQGQPITNSGRSNLSPSSDEPLKLGSANSQNTPQNQPTILASQAVMSQPTVTASQPAVITQTQPQIVAQPVATQQSNPALMVAQPNQAYLVQQPNQQPIYLSQQPSTQLVGQSSQQVVLPNGQVAQIISNGQPLVNGQTLVNNGQPMVNSGQQLLVSTNPGTNQLTLVQGARQNPSAGVQYAVVPVGQNNVAPNTNLGSSTGNTYLMVPGSNQLYTISG